MAGLERVESHTSVQRHVCPIGHLISIVRGPSRR